MGFTYDLVYGGSYCPQRNLAGLLRVADRAVQARRAGHTTGLRDMAEYLDMYREKDEDSSRMAFMFLLRYEQLMPTAHDPCVIDLARAIAERAFAALLAQASKFGLSLILVNQTTTQLETKELSTADVVRESTLAKIDFTVTGKRDIEQMQTLSGEDRGVLESRSTMPLQFSPLGVRDGEVEFVTSMLRRDEILDTSTTFGQALAIIDDGRGHREPARIQRRHALPLGEYRAPPPYAAPRSAASSPDGRCCALRCAAGHVVATGALGYEFSRTYEADSSPRNPVGRQVFAGTSASAVDMMSLGTVAPRNRCLTMSQVQRPRFNVNIDDPIPTSSDRGQELVSSAIKSITATSLGPTPIKAAVQRS